ncbi:MAG: MFS transporter, partial [Patescibacteria group bacterium]
FLVNLPIGILVFALCMALVPAKHVKQPGKVDVAGAIFVTSALMLAVYGIVNGNEDGWHSSQTMWLLGTALLLLLIFLGIESVVKHPLMPLRMFKNRQLAVANIVGVLWAIAMFAWFFISALYLQFVLGYSPLEVGLAFLPTNLIMAAFSLGLSARLVMKFGIRIPLSGGLGLAALGLFLFSLAPMEGSYLADVMPGMILLGIGGGMAFNPLLLAAMNGVPQSESGLASGIVNTSFMMGGALGLATLASLAYLRTEYLMDSQTTQVALNGGYHWAFLASALFAAIAAVLGATLLRETVGPANAHH